MQVTLWCCVLLVAYSYVLYPVLLKFLSLFHPSHGPIEAPANLPPITVVLSAYNEEAVIEERLKNLLSVDYPADRVKILVGNDGSVDGTGSVLASISDHRLQVFDFSTNRGKASVLNDLLQQVETELVVFTDANTGFDEQALTRLVRHFQDEKVGAVCGELRLEGQGHNQDGLYWRYEQFLKQLEARLGGLLGANGAIYAIRSELFDSLAADTLVDDFTVVMKIALRGHKVVYDDTALAFEEVAPTEADEFKRRVRIGAGNYQAFTRLLAALNPAHGMLTLTYISHKVLRWFTPHLMIVGVLCAAVLALDSALYLFLLIVVVGLVITTYVGVLAHSRFALLRLLGFWLSMNMALLSGFVLFVRGIRAGTWHSTDRSS
jgi:cellulose synthase/poly-beta-1,6-N-acetylglucosamine synthase-like glycosyltransferase